MISGLDISVALLKYCSLLALIRLLATAFNLEFGLSRRYLDVLEFVFHAGQQRIEKARSSRNQRYHIQGDAEEEPDGAHASVDASRQPAAAGEQAAPEGNRKSSAGSGSGCRSRRASNLDGPPVFLLDEFLKDGGTETLLEESHEFDLADPCLLVTRALSAIVDDQVTKRFSQEELKSWNLLTRTNARNYQFMSGRLGLYWLFGVLVRYALLMPLRIFFTLAGFICLSCSMCLVGLLPFKWRDKPYQLASLMAFRMLACGITSRLHFHNRQYRAGKGDICVANHTSPIDVVLLACDNCYALVGQRHAGLLGVLEKILSRAANHVWFDRAEMKDRQLVTQRIREHVMAKHNLPVLIFPEGTCINNSAVMMFRKGSFETTDTVCPVAIKYDSRFGDPFWNSSKQSYAQYLLLMMSSWAIKCDVWYLPRMERQKDELSAAFANRVKAEIAKQGGLVDLAWDGQLKRTAPKELWKHQQQEDYARHLKLE